MDEFTLKIQILGFLRAPYSFGLLNTLHELGVLQVFKNRLWGGTHIKYNVLQRGRGSTIIYKQNLLLHYHILSILVFAFMSSIRARISLDFLFVCYDKKNDIYKWIYFLWGHFWRIKIPPKSTYSNGRWLETPMMELFNM